MAKSKKIKVDPKKLKSAIVGAAAKAKELGWSPNTPKEEVDRAFDEPVFVNVNIRNIWGPWKRRGGKGNEGGFTVGWGAEKIGFGELTFYVKGGKFFCQTECMSKSFIKKAIAHLLETGVVYEHK